MEEVKEIQEKQTPFMKRVSDLEKEVKVLKHEIGVLKKVLRK